jgi:hypothetical protein
MVIGKGPETWQAATKAGWKASTPTVKTAAAKTLQEFDEQHKPVK